MDRVSVRVDKQLDRVVDRLEEVLSRQPEWAEEVARQDAIEAVEAELRTISREVADGRAVASEVRDIRLALRALDEKAQRSTDAAGAAHEACVGVASDVRTTAGTLPDLAEALAALRPAIIDQGASLDAQSAQRSQHLAATLEVVATKVQRLVEGQRAAEERLTALEGTLAAIEGHLERAATPALVRWLRGE